MTYVVYEGVTFAAETCKALGKERFIAMHLGAFWQDRDEETRRKMLAEVWQKVKPAKKGKNQ